MPMVTVKTLIAVTRYEDYGGDDEGCWTTTMMMMMLVFVVVAVVVVLAVSMHASYCQQGKGSHHS